MPAAGAPIADSSNTNNRRVSTSPPPPSLEQKFELLEARFTQPLGLSGNTNNGNNNNATFSSPQERGINGFGTNENSNLSEHSFSFSGGSNSNSNLQPMMTVRSKRRNSRSLTSLDIVNRAAAKHMRKVAANSPVMDGGVGPPTIANKFSFSSHSINSNSGSPGTLGSDSNNSNSQQTVVAGNRTNGTGSRLQKSQSQLLQQQQQPLSQQSQPPEPERVVAESPPVVVSPPKGSSSTKPKVARALQIGNSKQEQQQQQPNSAGGSAVSLILSYLWSLLLRRCNEQQESFLKSGHRGILDTVFTHRFCLSLTANESTETQVRA